MICMQGRLTLLLGPPGAGKTTLLKLLAGKLQGDPDLKVCSGALLPCCNAPSWDETRCMDACMHVHLSFTGTLVRLHAHECSCCALPQRQCPEAGMSLLCRWAGR
jgi:ABC-type hemin transport system ATPase subunit